MFVGIKRNRIETVGAGGKRLSLPDRAAESRANTGQRMYSPLVLPGKAARRKGFAVSCEGFVCEFSSGSGGVTMPRNTDGNPGLSARSGTAGEYLP